jgi:predicted PurR-regulated permease PerM
MEASLVQPESSRKRRLWILAGLWVFAFAVLVVFRSVVLPFAGAALIAYLVAPLVDRLTGVRFGGWHMPRWVAILVIYFCFFAAVYGAAVALVPQLYRELARISRDGLEYLNSLTPDRIRELSTEAEQWLAERGVPIEASARSLEGSDEPTMEGHGWNFDLEQLIHTGVARIAATLKENLGDIVTLSRAVITRVLAGVFMFFFILMVAAFFSIDVRTIKRYVQTLIPPEYAGDVQFLVRSIDRSLSGVVRGQVTICVVNGILTLIGLMLLKVKFAFLLATIAMLFSLIPIFGTIISSVPIVAIGLAQGWKTGFLALAWIIGIHALEAYVLNPKIMGTAAKIHPVVVAFSLIAGERMFGLIGALFAVPIAAIVVALFDFARLKAQPPKLDVVSSTESSTRPA